MDALPDHVAGLVLAAGLSRRMAPLNKLLIRGAAGEAMVVRVVSALLASRVTSVHVVLGHQREQVASALAGMPVTLIHAAGYQEGIAASLRQGIEALPVGAAAALVCLGDMPGVGADVIDQIIEAYAPSLGRLVVVPSHGGKRGNPVLWDRRFFPGILALEGDRGARVLFRAAAHALFELPVQSPAVLTDFDTLDTLEALP